MSGFNHRRFNIEMNGSVQTVRLCPHVKNRIAALPILEIAAHHLKGCGTCGGKCLACKDGEGIQLCGAPHPPGTLPPPRSTTIPPPPRVKGGYRVSKRCDPVMTPPPIPASMRKAPSRSQRRKQRRKQQRSGAAAQAAAGSPEASSSEPMEEFSNALRKNRENAMDGYEAKIKARKNARKNAEDRFQNKIQSYEAIPSLLDSDRDNRVYSRMNRGYYRRLADGSSLATNNDASHGIFILLPILVILMLVFFMCRKHTKTWLSLLSPTAASSSITCKSLRDNREKPAMRL